MDKLINYINEAKAESNNTSVVNMGLPLSELEEDYKNIDWATGQEKKDIIAKYNSPSKKKGDIQKLILLQMREDRKTRKNFNIDDFKWFVRLSDLPSRYANLEKWLVEEPIEFVMFLKNYYEEKKEKIRNPYNMSQSDKFIVTMLNNIVKFIDEHDPSKIASKAEQKKVDDIILNILLEQMKDFHDSYIEKIKNWADKYYSGLPDNKKKLTNKLKNVRKQYDTAFDEYHNSGKHVRYWQNPYNDELKKTERALNKINIILNKFKTKQEYIDKSIEEGENIYLNNVKAIVSRIKDKEFDTAQLKVINVREDPKFFEMTITDNTKKVYCRSIFAAATSVKMIPHFRFIITDRK